MVSSPAAKLSIVPDDLPAVRVRHAAHCRNGGGSASACACRVGVQNTPHASGVFAKSTEADALHVTTSSPDGGLSVRSRYPGTTTLPALSDPMSHDTSAFAGDPGYATGGTGRVVALPLSPPDVQSVAVCQWSRPVYVVIVP